MDGDLEIEKTKRNALEQYGKQEMLEVTGIPHEDGENCIDIIYKLCELTSTNIKKSKIDINESLSFDTKKFLFHVRNKSRTFGYNTVITDNGLTKVKTINEKEDYKWVKIANKNDLDKLK